MERLLALIRPGFKEAEPDCKTHPGQTRSHTPNPCRGFPTLVRGIAAAGEASGQGRLPVVPVSGSGLGSGRGSAEGRGRIACGLPVGPFNPVIPWSPPVAVQFWTPQRRDEDLIGGAVIQRRRKPLAAFRLFSSSQCSLES